MNENDTGFDFDGMDDLSDEIPDDFPMELLDDGTDDLFDFAYVDEARPERSLRYERVRLFSTAVLFGVAPVLYLLNSSILSWVIQNNLRLFTNYMENEVFSLCFDGLYSAVCVMLPFLLVYLPLRKLRLLPKAPLGGARQPFNAALLLVIGVGCCFLGNIITSYVSLILENLGIRFYSSEYLVETISGGWGIFLLSVLRGCVAPALFEEFAFRGVVLQVLRRYGDWFAILFSALLFGLLHGNMVQMPFAFLIGIVLGYCAVVTDSLWVGIGIHFLNNFCSTVYTAADSRFAAHPEYADFMWLVMTYMFIAAGAVAAIVYVRRNRNFHRLYPPKNPFLRHRLLLVLLAPPVLFSVWSFVSSMLMDIIGFEEWLEGIRQSLAILPW